MEQSRQKKCSENNHTLNVKGREYPCRPRKEKTERND